MKQEMIAMILAGGQGTRLGKLTQSVAKPAVPFGGGYRIIDFAMSNCVNSGIEHIGVITQYQPLSLNAHIGTGRAWGLGGKSSAATILQPYSSSKGAQFFEGTAHAILQNIDYIDSLNPDYVLILSGDHIYKMNYDLMLQEHMAHGASLTVGVIPVPMNEASRFGIMNTDSQGRIIEFEEKPAQPKSNLASMGIYIFDWAPLRQLLLDDQAGEKKMEDFGKNVIPHYLATGQAIYAYSFKGYWKDVGTIESLWEANMEFLDQDHDLNIRDRHWRIYSNAPTYPAQKIGEKASLSDSMVLDGCRVDGSVNHSILSRNVTVGQDARVEESFIMSGAQIGQGAHVAYAIVGEDAIIEPGARVEGSPDAIAVVGHSERVRG